MTIRIHLFSVTLFSLLSACGGPGENATVPQAEPAEASSTDIGGYVVHYSAQATADLPQEVAMAYGIARTRNSAMLNVSIQRKDDRRAVAGDVEVAAVNLTGQLKNVTMRRIDEQDAIYYIGVTNVDNRETLIYNIDVTPEGSTEAASIRFKRQFYTD